MSFITLTFDGVTVSAYQESEINTQIKATELPLYAGGYFGAVSSKTRDFPVSYECYIESITEYNTLKAKIGQFKTLVADGVTYTNCYISALGTRKEIIRGSGKYTYKISFSQVDQH